MRTHFSIHQVSTFARVRVRTATCLLSLSLPLPALHAQQPGNGNIPIPATADQLIFGLAGDGTSSPRPTHGGTTPLQSLVPSSTSALPTQAPQPAAPAPSVPTGPVPLIAPTAHTPSEDLSALPVSGQPLPLVSAAQSVGELKFGVLLDRREATYKEGDLLRIRFRAVEDCYLYVINYDSTGNGYLLFPNQYHPDPRVSKDQTVEYPTPQGRFQYRVTGPFGNESIVCLASSADLKLFPNVAPERAPVTALTTDDLIQARSIMSKAIRVEQTLALYTPNTPNTSSAPNTSMTDSTAQVESAASTEWTGQGSHANIETPPIPAIRIGMAELRLHTVGK